jgi:hypothetical protein
VSLRKWIIEDFAKARSNRVVPRNLAFAPDRGESFFIFSTEKMKGGGSVESDLSDLDLEFDNRQSDLRGDAATAPETNLYKMA